MRVLDLFSGIGGFSLGLERAGMETIAFVEQDKACQKVLKKHWPEIPIYQDVRTLNGKDFERNSIDLICGGFPCQPFSTAGKRGGKEDDRHLWPEMFRLIQEIRPRWVIGENVTGIISMELENVLSDLEGENYTVQAVNIPACAVSHNHRRERVWILAYSMQGIGSLERDIGGFWGEWKQIQGNTICQNETSPRMVRTLDGIPGGLDRLKQLGNAVVPQIVEIIGRAIMEADRNDQ